MSRPPKYHPGLCDQARYICAVLGATSEQLAKALGVSDRVIYDWQREHPEFLQAVVEGKAEFDQKNIDHSILACANGYWYQEEQYDAKSGAIVRLWKFRHPDLKALALWQCNRQGWRLPPAGPATQAALPTPPARGNDLPPGHEEPGPDAARLAELADLARAALETKYGTRIRVSSTEVKPVEPEKHE